MAGRYTSVPIAIDFTSTDTTEGNISMANRLPPSQRPERRQPDRTLHPRRTQSTRLRRRRRPRLRLGAARRAGRILLLCDRRRDEAHNLCVECWGGRPLDHARLRSGDYLVGVHPLAFLDLLSRSGANLRAASQELLAFSRLPASSRPPVRYHGGRSLGDPMVAEGFASDHRPI